MTSGLIDIATKIKPASAAAPLPTMTKKLSHRSNIKSKPPLPGIDERRYTLRADALIASCQIQPESVIAEKDGGGHWRHWLVGTRLAPLAPLAPGARVQDGGVCSIAAG